MEGNAAFFRTVKTDFKMGLKFQFLLSILGVFCGFCFDNWQDLRNFFISPLLSGEKSSLSVLYYFFNAFSFGSRLCFCFGNPVFSAEGRNRILIEIIYQLYKN